MRCTRRPVTQELLKRINLTSHLAVMSIIVAMLIALPIGVLSAVKQDTASDYIARFLAILGLSLPDFWLATVIIPVITVIGQQFSVLLGGTVIVEFIFLQPGVGSLMLDAVLLRDYTLIQGAVLFFAVVIVVTNLLVDLSYAWLDPRIRYR